MADGLNPQSRVIDEKNGVRINSKLKQDNLLVTTRSTGHTTLAEEIYSNFHEIANKPCLGERPEANAPLEYITYGEMKSEALTMANNITAFVDWGIGADKIIGIFSKNQARWTILAQACTLSGLIMVPVYPTLGKDACIQILNQTEMKIIFCGTIENIKSVLANLDQTPSLKFVVLMNRPNDDTKDEFERLKREHADRINLCTYDDIKEAKKTTTKELTRDPKPDDIILICYTSGTTGKPKGVVLTNKNIISMIAGAEDQLGEIEATKTVHFSYLPLAHIFEQIVQFVVLVQGGQIAFLKGEITELFNELTDVNPTLFIAVPRIVTRLYDRFLAAKKPEWTEAHIEGALAKFRKMFGTSLQSVILGGAAMPKDAKDFLKRVVNCKVYEGYGQTETSGAITMTNYQDSELGQVGPPHKANYVKLADVPDMNLFVSRDGRGEVCAKGSNCTQGYYKSPELTAELIDKDGWLHTGDVGEWTKNGTLRIVDRCKNMFKLAQGEYVVPDKVETIYSKSSLVEQVFIDGNGEQTNPVALIKPDEAVKKARLDKAEADWLASNAAVSGSEKETGLLKARDLAMEQLKSDILNDIRDIGSKNGLGGFEQVKLIALIDVTYSIENNMLTPTLKCRRPEIRKYFENELNELYENVRRLALVA